MSYADEVLADLPSYYWRMGDAAPLLEEDGGPSITISGATAVADGQGPLTVGDEGARSFDGVDDWGQTSATVDLSALATITVEFWLKWDAYADNDDQAMELGSGGQQTFTVVPNSAEGAASGSFEVYLAPHGAEFWHSEYFTRPTAGTWHHYVFVLDRTAATNDQQILAYVDGQEVATTVLSSDNRTGNFANATLNFMCRNAAGSFGAGDMAHAAIYAGILSAARILAHYEAGRELGPPPDGVYRGMRFEGASMRYG